MVEKLPFLMRLIFQLLKEDFFVHDDDDAARQCGQMVILLIQNMAVYSNLHLPNTIKIGQIWFKNCQKIKMLAKVATFRQIYNLHS